MADEQLIFQKRHKRPNLKKKINDYNCQAFPKRNGNAPIPTPRNSYQFPMEATQFGTKVTPLR